MNPWKNGSAQQKAEGPETACPPPEPCPWCGKEMEQGFLTGGRDSVRWYPGVHKFDPLRALDGNALDLLDEGDPWGVYKTVWLCRDCKKAVFNMPDPPEDYGPFAAPAETEETKEEEESEE